MDEATGAGREGRLNNLYLAVISRYKEYIEEKEGLSVAELPTLVTPNSERVIEKANWIRSKFLNYTYDKDFYDASIMAFDFINDEIEDVTLPLQFWISPDEVMTFMMGDIMDKSILLCSILIRLGNPSSRVFVKIDDSARKVFVYYEFGEEFPCTGMREGAKGIQQQGRHIEKHAIQRRNCSLRVQQPDVCGFILKSAPVLVSLK